MKMKFALCANYDIDCMVSYLVYSTLILDASGALCALETPLTDENLMFAPHYTNLLVTSGSF